MLTIIHDPAAITGRHRYPWDLSRSVQANIEQHLAGGAECVVSFNGEQIDPATDGRMDWPPMEGDEVVIVRRPAEISTWVLVASALLAVAAYAMVPKLPGDTVAKESPNSALTGQTNLARTYQAIPDVYGLRRVWPDLIQPSSVEYIDQVKFVTEWLCVSRGRGTITNVQYAETPIADIDGASFQVFEPASTPNAYPEFNATTLTNVLETFASDDVNGQELPYAVSSADIVITRPGYIDATIASNTFSLRFTDSSAFDPLKGVAGTGSAVVYMGFYAFAESCTVDSYSVSGGEVTFVFTGSTTTWAVTLNDEPVTAAIEITGVSPTTTTVGPFTMPVDSEGLRYNIVFLRGLKGTVNIRAEWWKIDSGGVEISGTRAHQDDTYIADTFDQRYYTTTVFPAAGLGRYRIEFTRLNVATADGSDVAKLEEVYAVRRYATKVLPGVTVVRVTTKATTQATGFADRKFNLRWQRHVRTLSSDTLSASRNFARAMAHLWTITGQQISELDTTTLAAINTEHGETSALLRFDGVFDDADMSLGERMQRIAYHARCVMWRDGTKWTATRDQARAFPDVQLDYRNLAAGGESSISYAAHLPASNDGVEVEYVDETTLAKKAYVRLSIASGSVAVGTSSNPLKIKLPGCCTSSQATNRAHLEARRLMYQRVSVNDTALADGGQLGIGSLVKWIDPNDFAGEDGMQAGEVMSLTGTVITTSEDIDWKSQTTGRMLFTGTDGKHIGSPIVVTPVAGGVNLASVPAGLFVRDDARQVGSRYVFAVGLTAAELQAAGLYTVTSVRPGADRTVSLAFATYDERMYEED